MASFCGKSVGCKQCVLASGYLHLIWRAGGRSGLGPCTLGMSSGACLPCSLQYGSNCLLLVRLGLVVFKADVVLSLEVRDGAAEVLEGFPDH